MGRSQPLGVLNKLYGDRGRNVVHRVPRFGASKMRAARFPGRAARLISLSADFHLALARSREGVKGSAKRVKLTFTRSGTEDADGPPRHRSNIEKIYIKSRNSLEISCRRYSLYLPPSLGSLRRLSRWSVSFPRAVKKFDTLPMRPRPQLSQRKNSDQQTDRK